MIDLIGFDADDTLWHNEILYTRTQERFELLLSGYGLDGNVQEELFATEMQNLGHYGYGIKAFTLSMIETAIRLTGGRIGGAEIEEILELSRDMMYAPVELLDQAAEVVADLSSRHRLMVITKGDLFDQERKLARSGLASYFAHAEIVSEKTVDVYRSLLAKHRVDPRRFLMVGNSLRSDILPVIELGGKAVHIPYHTTWAHEAVAVPDAMPAGYVELENIGLLPGLVERLIRSGDKL
jgi:putative hydrolase of the HAD superfamily